MARRTRAKREAAQLSAYYQRLPDSELSGYHVDMCDAVAAGAVTVDFSADPMTFRLTGKGRVMPIDPAGRDGVSRIVTVMRGPQPE